MLTRMPTTMGAGLQASILRGDSKQFVQARPTRQASPHSLSKPIHQPRSLHVSTTPERIQGGDAPTGRSEPLVLVTTPRHFVPRCRSTNPLSRIKHCRHPSPHFEGRLWLSARPDQTLFMPSARFNALILEEKPSQRASKWPLRIIQSRELSTALCMESPPPNSYMTCRT